MLFFVGFRASAHTALGACTVVPKVTAVLTAVRRRRDESQQLVPGP